MNAYLLPNEHDAPGAPWRVAVAVVFYVALAGLVAAALSAAVVRGLEGQDGALARFVMQKGPEKVTIRFLQLFGLAFLPWLLRRIGWRGPGDFGFRAPGQHAGEEAGDLFRGLGLGLGSLAFLAATQVLSGQRSLVAPHSAVALAGALLGFAVSAAVVAGLEETLARGMLYRSLARIGSPVGAALGLSLFFGAVHFLRPEASAFARPTWWASTLAVYRTTFTSALGTPDFVVRFVNLVLLSLLLCAFVARRGTIWLALGTHAGWVFGLRTNARVTDITHGLPARSPWFGIRPELTDAWLATLLLALLLAGALLFMRPTRARE